MKCIVPISRAGVRTALAAIVISALAVSCGGSTGSKRLLQMKVFPQDSFILYFSGDSRVSVTFDGNEVAIGGESDAAYRFQVASIDPNGVVEFNVKVQSAEYPSLKAPLGPALSGESFSLRVSPAGEVLGLGGTDELRSRVDSKLDLKHFAQWVKTETPEEKALRLESYRKRILSMLTDDAIRATFEPVLRVWPATPVAIGDSWSRDQIPIQCAYPGVYGDTELSVTSLDAGEVSLSVSGTIQTLPEDSQNVLSGETSGTITIDPVAGFVKSATLVNTYTGTVSMEANPERTPVDSREELYYELLRL